MTPLVSQLEKAGEGSLADLIDRLTLYEHREGYDGKDWEKIASEAAEAIRALAASPSVGGWEDISTAPKDGSAFLIAYDNGSVRAGYYLDNSHTPFPWKGVRPAHGTEPVTAKITHWMPLPPPPSVSTDNGSRPQEAVPTEQAAPPVVVPRDQLETLRRSLELGNLLPGEGETLINCWIFASEAESKA